MAHAPMVVLLGFLLVALARLAHAEVWQCPGPQGTLLYQDHAGPHCQRLTLPEGRVENSQVFPPPVRKDGAPTPPAAPARPPRDSVAARRLMFSFSPVVRSVPVLMVNAVADPRFTLPNPGDGGFVELTIRHLAEGEGPDVHSDESFRGQSDASLLEAVRTAAKFTNYDPRFLRVELRLPMTWTARLIHRGLRIDGPSAGVAYAVAIAAGLLGDPIRPGVCLSGTISANGQVGMVGGLEDKIDGCHALGGHMLVIPKGQYSFELEDKRQTYEIQVISLSTFFEAYWVATGKPLRALGAE